MVFFFFFLDGALVVDCKAVLNAVSATDHTRYQHWSAHELKHVLANLQSDRGRHTD